jgi:hypothetical protein
MRQRWQRIWRCVWPALIDQAREKTQARLKQTVEISNVLPIIFTASVAVFAREIYEGKSVVLTVFRIIAIWRTRSMKKLICPFTDTLKAEVNLNYTLVFIQSA